MATLTTNLGLTKPATTDFYDIGVQNTNMDLLDTAVTGKASAVHTHPIFGTCATAASTAAKTVTLDSFTLEVGVMIVVKFSNNNTASNATLNVNSTGAKTLRYNNANVTTTTIRANYMAAMVYDGTYWQIITLDGFSKTRFEVVTYTGTGSRSKTVSTSLPSARAGFISGNSRIMFKFGVGSGTAALGTATYTGYYTDWSFSGTSLTVSVDDADYAGYAMNSDDDSYSVIFWE